MELPWLKRLAQPCRLLLHALASGPSGTLAALRVLQRVQAREEPGGFPWQGFTATLCMEEPTLEGLEEALAVKPRLLLLPVMCQRNLFSLLQAAVVPADCVRQLLRAARGDPSLDPWVRALGDLLQQGLRGEEPSPPPPALTAACRQQLRCLCQKITRSKPEGRRKLKWCSSEQLGAAGDAAGSVLPGGKRKKVSEESLELGEERGGKRVLLEEVVFELPGSQDGEDEAGVEEMPVETAGDGSAQSMAGAAPESSQQDAAGEPGRISQTEVAAEVQSFIQMHGPRLKMLLLQESNRSELSIPPELRVLSNCSASQLSTCPEPLLVRFCSWLLALTPDLSYASAAILAEQLFLKRVLSLTQPPSRHLMAALTSFCSKYSQPFCRVLVAPVLQEPGEGAEQTKLVCELVEECLEPDYVRLVLSQVLEVPLSERLLPVVLAVLGRQEALPPELFDLLVLTLCRQAPAFATSLSYAKLVTAVLTMYQSHVTPAHRSRLAAALDGSNAALKKSLQAVLEGVPAR
ncbi:Fanconi anemia group E protein isoform X3 [Oxyura jamaicensis]|uniref:Fanconi anemia group E protein isoform X3 n=1 Tax=Oxyura jamaicensis TaxID=8884 RepID=UPI0015A56370|nr:Fanconi anemia group E protein isoform X3 [Oxyura jamaicensis]